MNLALSSCVLTVHDVAAALGFYRDVLGFTASEQDGKISVSSPSQPDVRIVLRLPDTDAAENLMANGLLAHLVFETDDCDATFEHIEAAGTEVMQEPISHPGNARDCAFRDPSGNIVRFRQLRSRAQLRALDKPTEHN